MKCKTPALNNPIQTDGVNQYYRNSLIFVRNSLNIEESDLATAILRRKSAPNKLMVDESPQDNNSMIYLSENTLEKLGLFRSDSVLLKGKKRRETIAVVLASPECDDNKIKMNKGNNELYLSFYLEICSYEK